MTILHSGILEESLDGNLVKLYIYVWLSQRGSKMARFDQSYCHKILRHFLIPVKTVFVGYIIQL